MRKKLIVFFILCLALSFCGCTMKEEQVGALKQQIAALQDELDMLSKDAFLQESESLISLENARRSFYEKHYEGLLPDTVQTVASSINLAIDAGQPLDKFTAYVYSAERRENKLELLIDRIERNPDWSDAGNGDVEFFINEEELKEKLEINEAACLAIDPHSQLTLAAMDESFGKYVERKPGMEPAAFDFYTCAGMVLFIIEAYAPEG